MTKDVMEETKEKLDDSKRSLEEMISKYMKKIDDLETASTAVSKPKLVAGMYRCLL